MAPQVAHASRISVTRVNPADSLRKETSLNEPGNPLGIGVIQRKSVSYYCHQYEPMVCHSADEQEIPSGTAWRFEQPSVQNIATIPFAITSEPYEAGGHSVGAFWPASRIDCRKR